MRRSTRQAGTKRYEGERLNHLAFPMGGIGSGMICLEGTGALSHVSLRNRPDVQNEPLWFSALCIKGAGGKKNLARVLEGPVPKWKATFPWGSSSGNGAGGHTFGLPRFASASFVTRFPFGKVTLRDRRIPLGVTLTGWSPFLPGNADESSLPAAAVEYRFRNRSSTPVDAVYSFHSSNFMLSDYPPTGKRGDAVRPRKNGFTLHLSAQRGRPEAEGSFSAFVKGATARSNCAWFRGGWFDAVTMTWKDIESGRLVSRARYADKEVPSGGGSLYVPLKLQPGEEKTVRLLFAWYVPKSNLSMGEKPNQPCSRKGGSRDSYVPWYATQFNGVDAVADHWSTHYERLRRESAAFADAFYDTTLPPEVIEAAAANLSILKSPTVLRQHDGRIWAWEGCCDGRGCCAGSCTHVWNYAQALPHLFPDLERTLRQTEFHENQDRRGHQAFRAWLPIRPIADHGGHAASDGQLGGIMKMYREWRVSGDTKWMRAMWPRVKQSLSYCIQAWDPDHLGVLVEPHHNTYDIEFWGPDGMCSSFYLGALAAAARMGRECGADVSLFEELLAKGRKYLEKKLFNGQYFEQKVQ